MKLSIEMVKKGIVAALPFAKVLAAQTKTQIDDQFVAFLEVVLVADAAHLQEFIDKAPTPASAGTTQCEENKK